MGYKPTLGGLKEAQEFLRLNGFHLPIFQMNIFMDGRKTGVRWAPGDGKTMPIDAAIARFGTMAELVDVRLTNEKGDKFVQFSNTEHFDSYVRIRANSSGWDVVFEYHGGHPFDYEFDGFMRSYDGTMLLNLARWGKMRPTIRNRLAFHFLATEYGRRVFA